LELFLIISCLDLIEAKTTGCFDLLDEESKLPTPRAEHFTTEVHNRNKGHARLDVKKQQSVSSSLIDLACLVSKKIEITCIT
jgi:myosin heavy subunit